MSISNTKDIEKITALAFINKSGCVHCTDFISECCSNFIRLSLSVSPDLCRRRIVRVRCIALVVCQLLYKLIAYGAVCARFDCVSLCDCSSRCVKHIVVHKLLADCIGMSRLCRSLNRRDFCLSAFYLCFQIAGAVCQLLCLNIVNPVCSTLEWVINFKLVDAVLPLCFFT